MAKEGISKNDLEVLRDELEARKRREFRNTKTKNFMITKKLRDAKEAID